MCVPTLPVYENCGKGAVLKRDPLFCYDVSFFLLKFSSEFDMISLVQKCNLYSNRTFDMRFVLPSAFQTASSMSVWLAPSSSAGYSKSCSALNLTVVTECPRLSYTDKNVKKKGVMIPHGVKIGNKTFLC